MGDDVADVLERAADLLWVRGRCRGRDLGPDGELCVEKAVEVVANEDHVRANAALAALDAYLDTGAMAALWNDDTDDDELVIDTLRRCAKSLRESA